MNTKFKKNFLYSMLLASPSVFVSNTSMADCVADYSNYRIVASDGSTCTASEEAYYGLNTVSAYGKDTQLIFTGQNVQIFSGNTLTVPMAIGGQAASVRGSGATIIAEHNLEVHSTNHPGLGRSVYFHDTDTDNLNTLYVKGNLTAVTGYNKTSSDGMISLNNKMARLNVDGNVNIQAGSGNLTGNMTGLGNWGGGIVNVGKSVNINGMSLGIATFNGSQTYIQGNLDIATRNGIALNNNGIMTVAGDSTLTNSSSYISNTTGSSLTFKGNLTTSGKAIVINDASEINFFGLSSQLDGNVYNNNGAVLNLSNGKTDGKLVIGGDYSATDGIIKIDTHLGADGSPTDFIQIDGNATGSTELQVNNVGGNGLQTQKGIHVIQTGSSESDKTFFIKGDYLSAGAYDYGLFRQNENSLDNWYLKSHLRGGTKDTPVYTPDTGSYLAAETMGNTLFTSRLEDREGASQYQNLGAKNNGNVWVRAYGGHHQFKSMNEQLKTKGNSFVTQIGSGLVTLGQENQYNLGVMAGFASYDGKTQSELTGRESKAKVDGYSLGLYGTWYAHPVEKRGAYVDTWVLWNKFKNKIDSADQKRYDYDSSGITASIEIGGDYLLNKNSHKNWWIQPQAQVIYQGVHADHFKDAQNVNIDHGKDNLQARLGFKTYLDIPTNEAKLTSYRPFIALNYIHNTSPYSVVIDDVRYENNGSKDLGEIKLGVEGRITQNNQVWLNASYVAGSQNNQTYQGNIGWKYSF